VGVRLKREAKLLVALPFYIGLGFERFERFERSRKYGMSNTPFEGFEVHNEKCYFIRKDTKTLKYTIQEKHIASLCLSVPFDDPTYRRRLKFERSRNTGCRIHHLKDQYQIKPDIVEDMSAFT
jgi:hypothetical protein